MPNPDNYSDHDEFSFSPSTRYYSHFYEQQNANLTDDCFIVDEESSQYEVEESVVEHEGTNNLNDSRLLATSFKPEPSSTRHEDYIYVIDSPYNNEVKFYLFHH